MSVRDVCAWRPSARAWRRAHGLLAVLWAVFLPFAVLTDLRNSVPLLVGISVYALVVGHFGAYQGARAEDVAS